MLPDIRAVFAAFVAAVGLLTIAFAATAAFRVAQEARSVSFQADLAQRGHAVQPQGGQRVTVIETPGPHLAPLPALPSVDVTSVPVGAEVSAVPVIREEPAPDAAPLAIAAPREEPVAAEPVAPVGGPLAEPSPSRSKADAQAARTEQARKLAAARKAREARLARQRRAAAVRRAARARAQQQQQQQQQPAAQTFNSGFGSAPFGGSFGRQ